MTVTDNTTRTATRDTGPVASGGVDPAGPKMVIVDLPVAAIAENPKNPRSELPKVDEMAASMETNGLLQPVVVVPMAAFLAEQPDLDVQIQARPGLEYVAVMGHRRCAAAERLGWETIPGIVRPDLASAQLAMRTMIVENMQRQGLTPIEEAKGFAELVTEGLSQREIARECGFSQPYVSKRLALLQLPEGAQARVAAGEVKLADAVKLAALPPAAREEAWFDWIDSNPWGDDLGTVVEEAERKLEDAKKLQAHRQQAVDEGVELVDDLQEAFGRSYWDHQLYNDRQIAKARKAGTLRAHATAHKLEYYSTIPRESARSASSNSEEQKAKAVKKAAKSRGPALARLVATPPTIEVMAAEMAAAIVNGKVTHADALKTVRSWLPSDRFPQPPSEGLYGGGVYAWRDAIEAEDWPWVAWAMTVATTEQDARAPYLTWGERQASHVQRLIDQAEYEPTDWESEQLYRIRRETAEAADRAKNKTDQVADDQVAEGAVGDNAGIAEDDRGCDPDCGCDDVDVDETDAGDPEENSVDAADQGSPMKRAAEGMVHAAKYYPGSPAVKVLGKLQSLGVVGGYIENVSAAKIGLTLDYGGRLEEWKNYRRDTLTALVEDELVTLTEPADDSDSKRVEISEKGVALWKALTW